ncbi:glycoside hydrolase family 10 protein [Leptolyngbya sp. FACHB-541]|uniref:glycoside hydrolase family 10 protein n=1 Tax=Leptolyngbya sp. FACHB-541 TaxID=2692810 RepID=UPI0016870C55|nr:glycoside hydrolase family 10 protein [Leptolyngbya sp. FACHB-541]MBD1998208.1 glycoside hydrolase family 10 protein [Leptolyngbya sp. FACHB-541]
MRRKLPRWLTYLLSAGLALLVVTRPAIPQAISAPSSEIRGVWLTNVASGVLFLPQGVSRAVNQLAQLNFNTLYPVVWNRGYTTYPSSVTQVATGETQLPLLHSTRIGRSLLATFIQQGHQRNLRVIPWFEYGFMAPRRSSLVKRHPEWLTQYRDGSQVLKAGTAELGLPDTPETLWQSRRSRLRQLVRQQSSHQLVWLNPLHPQVQEFLLDLILEVVTRYDVDGIQLDDHFSLPVELGYDPFTAQLYRQEHQGNSPPDDPLDEEWMRWRANKLGDFMRRIFLAVKIAKPNCLISLSPNSPGFAYRHYLQDWQTWVRQGWLGEVIVQTYRNDLDRFVAELEQPAMREMHQLVPMGIGILTGTWNNPIAIAQIQQQVEAVRDLGFDGISFFYWESLWGYITPEPPRERRKGFQSLFLPTAQVESYKS